MKTKVAQKLNLKHQGGQVRISRPPTGAKDRRKSSALLTCEGNVSRETKPGSELGAQLQHTGRQKRRALAEGTNERPRIGVVVTVRRRIVVPSAFGGHA
ncbi:hypothetical protein EVAR_99341_1 [Eumeta japonica]|uniref:Uncharacterized protein n=1 Tax=Eumeta variegata TaxID=151549 RepID=A0A4C1SGL8_EUMVA|nr:hypothetical protein EVAR_99341_1 [Eumeta japonica]